MRNPSLSHSVPIEMRLGWDSAHPVDRGTQETALMAIRQGVNASKVLLPLVNVPRDWALEVCWGRRLVGAKWHSWLVLNSFIICHETGLSVRGKAAI